MVTLNALKQHTFLPPDVVAQEATQALNRARLHRNALRFKLAPGRRGSQKRVLIQQPPLKVQRKPKRKQEPLLVIKVSTDLPPPRPDKRHNRVKPSPGIHRPLKAPRQDQAPHVLA